MFSNSSACISLISQHDLRVGFPCTAFLLHLLSVLLKDQTQGLSHAKEVLGGRAAPSWIL